MISLYHIYPSKVRAYNSKGELKILLFYVCTPISMQPDKYIYVLGAGIRGGGAGIRGGGPGIRGGGACIRGRGVGIRAGGVGIREGEWV